MTGSPALAPRDTVEAPPWWERLGFGDGIAGASPVILYVFDLERNQIVFCDPAVEAILGYPAAAIRGMSGEQIADLVHPDDQPLLPARLARLAAASGPETIESDFRVRHARGDWRWLAVRETAVAREAAGGPRRILGAAIDVTSRKQAEIALRDSQRRYALATAAGRVVVWDFDIASGRMTVEPPFPELLGFAPGEYDDPNAWEDYIHPADRQRVRGIVDSGFAPDAPRDADGNSRCPETEYRALGPHGQTYWVSDRGTVLRRPDGTPYRALGAIVDITGRKRVEDALRKVTSDILRAQDDERRRIASDLHDGVAQDLAAIAIHLMRLQAMAPDLSADAVAALTAAQDLGERALRQVRTLSYLLHPPLLEEGGLPDAIRDFARGFAKRTGIAVDTDAVAPIGAIGQDAETALYRVVQECLLNMQRHSGSDTAAIRLDKVLDEIVLEVSDRGRGMDGDGRAPGNSGPGRAGVGIASMRERLRGLGGRLEVRTGPWGTAITARIPAQPAPQERAAP